MTNIVMITFDDLNDWSSVLGGYAGTVHTPNLERVAAGGSSFANAFSVTPGCNPSRSSTLTGMSPLTTGVIGNDEPLFGQVDPSVTLPGQLAAAGWTTISAGKVFHELPEAVGDQLYTDVLVPQGTAESGEKQPGGVVRTTETVVAGVYVGELDDLVDIQVTKAVVDYLGSYQPTAGAPGLFLSAGITRPHTPHIAPQEFFDLYPLESIVLPETLPDDLGDIPGFEEFFGDPAAFDRTLLAEEWRPFVQAYLASISFADWMLGQMLDALEASAIADDTMVVVWSDHGYHLGEKQHIGKFTLWEEAARSHLIIAPPGGGATEGRLLNTPVSLMDLYPTLLDYAEVPIPDWAEGQSLRELIDTGNADGLRGQAITSIGGSHSIRTAGWRYTKYENGSEELYDLKDDPEAFVNLADDPDAAARKESLIRRLEAQLDTVPFLQNRGDTPTVLDASASGEKVLLPGNADDTLIGGDQDNIYQTRLSGVTIIEAADGGIDLVNTTTGFTLPDNVENLRYVGGTGGAEGVAVLAGNALDNLIRVSVGRAELRGGAGDDTLESQGSADTLEGGDGDDYLESIAGDDLLDGGAGDDTMRGGADDDVYRLSAGSDAISERRDGGFDTVDVSAWGGLGAVRITERRGGERLTGLVLEQIDGTARTTINVEDGVPTIEALTDGTTTLLLVAGRASGSDLDETLRGSAGDDTLAGLDGADVLAGGDGRDNLAGGDGDDTVAGGAGDDTLDGGKGTDTASYADATGGVRVSLGGAAGAAQNTGGAGTDRLSNFENLRGGDFGDALSGQAKANRLEGGDGDDTLSGFGGDDTIVGGGGADLLRGGDGLDRFVFTMDDVAGDGDRIVDFAAGDVIDLTAIDLNPATERREFIRFDLDARNPDRVDVRFRLDGDTTVIELAIGRAGETLTIVLDGAVALTASDFLL